MKTVLVPWNRLRIDRKPNVWWYVQGRKLFDTRYSTAIRRMWGCGNYGAQP
jgi:hypothetical protein